MVVLILLTILWLVCFILVKLANIAQFMCKRPPEPPPAFDVPLPRLWRLARIQPDSEFALTSGFVCAETEDDARKLLNAEETARDPKLVDVWSNRGTATTGEPLITVKVIGYPFKGLAAKVLHCV